MADSITLGLFRIGSVDLALPAEFICKTVTGPIELADLPQAPLHVLGAFALDGEPIPTVDLATLIKPASAIPGRPVAFAMVIQHPAGRLAIQVDAILGVVKTTTDRLSAIATRTPGSLFAQVYTPETHGRVTAILDLDALLATTGILAAVRPSARLESSDSTHAALVPVVMFTAAGQTWAADAAQVRLVTRYPARLESLLDHPFVRGFHDFAGQTMPVIDWCALLGATDAKPAEAGSPVIIFTNGRASCAVSIDTLIAVEQAAASAEIPPETQPSALYAGSFIDRRGRVALRVDIATLFRALQLDADELEAAAAPTASDQAAVPRQYLVYRTAGFTLATALSELEAVMEVPSDHVALEHAEGAHVGFCSRLNRPVRVLDLARVLGAPAEPFATGAPMLVVDSPAGLQGLLVRSIDLLQTTTAQTLLGGGRAAQGAVPAVTHMIRARAAQFDRTASVLGLQQLAASLAAR